MDVSLLFPSRFMKSAEFRGKDYTFTIRGVSLEDLATDDGGSKSKGVVAFAETPKLWVLNRTNAACVAAMFGKETDAWIGKRVTLYPAPFVDPFTKERTTAIRVRGSPDIDKPVTAEVKLPKRKPLKMQMQPTGNGKGKQQRAPEQAPPPEPPPPADGYGEPVNPEDF